MVDRERPQEQTASPPSSRCLAQGCLCRTRSSRNQTPRENRMPEMSRMKGPWSRRGDESEWQGGLQMPVRRHLLRERGRARGRPQGSSVKSQRATGDPERRRTLEGPARLKGLCSVIGQRQPGRHDPSASESVASAAVGHHRSSEKRLSRRRPAPCTRLAAPGFDKSLGITETRKSCKLRPRVRPGCRRGRCLGSPSQQISGRRGELLCLRPSTRPQAPEVSRRPCRPERSQMGGRAGGTRQ